MRKTASAVTRSSFPPPRHGPGRRGRRARRPRHALRRPLPQRDRLLGLHPLARPGRESQHRDRDDVVTVRVVTAVHTVPVVGHGARDLLGDLEEPPGHHDRADPAADDDQAGDREHGRDADEQQIEPVEVGHYASTRRALPHRSTSGTPPPCARTAAPSRSTSSRQAAVDSRSCSEITSGSGSRTSGGEAGREPRVGPEHDADLGGLAATRALMARLPTADGSAAVMIERPSLCDGAPRTWLALSSLVAAAVTTARPSLVDRPMQVDASTSQSLPTGAVQGTASRRRLVYGARSERDGPRSTADVGAPTDDTTLRSTSCGPDRGNRPSTPVVVPTMRSRRINQRVKPP
jgi:hypothetical protein